MKPRKVYLIQNNEPDIIPQRKVAILEGNPSEKTTDRNAIYNTIVSKGKHSSSVLPPKLNILFV